MKRFILSVIAIMAFIITNAQDVKYGIKGGLNVSNFSNSDEDLTSKTGLNIGGFAEIKIWDDFFIQPELLYSGQGAIVENVHTEGHTGDIRFNLAYINVPVMFKYQIFQNFSIGAGPQIGFLASAKSKTKIDGFDRSYKMDVKDFFKPIDFGFNFGASCDFTENVSFEARYNFGRANIAKGEGWDNTKIYNGVLSCTLAYKF